MMNCIGTIAGSDLEYANSTTVHPVGLVALAVLAIATIWLPRRYALVPMLMMACVVPSSQRIVVFTLDFSFIRIIAMVALARIFVFREYVGFRWVRIDTLFFSVWAANAVVYTLQWGTTGALVNRMGVGFEALGVYFIGRLVMRDWQDLLEFIKLAALIAVPVALFFLFENQTRYNVFSVFGGVSSVTGIREGRLRCQGPFSHPIIAGVFWASLMPLFVALLWQGKRERLLAGLGVAGGLVIVYCCASSTPVLALAAGVFGATMYVARGRMQYFVWGGIGVLTILHLMMQAPVWHLIARISAVGGSTGWHRYHLIDACINHFDEWVFLGVKTTGHWGWGLQDVTNQYVFYAVTGGFVTLVLFVWLLVSAYSWRGDSSAASKRRSPSSGVGLGSGCNAFCALHLVYWRVLFWSSEYDLVSVVGDCRESLP